MSPERQSSEHAPIHRQGSGTEEKESKDRETGSVDASFGEAAVVADAGNAQEISGSGAHEV